MDVPCYQCGQDIRTGDQITLAGSPGTVLFVVDTDSYSPAYPKVDWQYLAKGFMVQTENHGLVHMPSADEDLVLVSRAPPDKAS